MVDFNTLYWKFQHRHLRSWWTIYLPNTVLKSECDLSADNWSSLWKSSEVNPVCPFFSNCYYKVVVTKGLFENPILLSPKIWLSKFIVHQYTVSVFNFYVNLDFQAVEPPNEMQLNTGMTLFRSVRASEFQPWNGLIPLKFAGGLHLGRDFDK